MLYSCPHSAESNAMSKAYVKTMRSDYVYTSDCYDAKTILKHIPEWIDDYNKNAPHSELNIMCTAEILKSTNKDI